jgi:hypothetical protein
MLHHSKIDEKEPKAIAGVKDEKKEKDDVNGMILMEVR